VANEDYTQRTLSGADAAPQNDETLKKKKYCKLNKKEKGNTKH
jgi:hypothetical protein